MSSLEEKVHLEYREGSSDKVYNAELEEKTPGMYVVTFSYGRRGSSLNYGAKTNAPVQYHKAKSIFDKLVNEKIGKGYQAVQGKGYTTKFDQDISGLNSLRKEDTGVKPQLLNELKEDQIPVFINDPAWGMQEKSDGQRKTLIYKDGKLTVGNKKGFVSTLASEIGEAFVKTLKKAKIEEITVDGEDMGSHIVLFDAISEPGGYLARYNTLKALIKQSEHVKIATLATTQLEKSVLYAKFRLQKAEGVVFKKLNAEYKPGRPASGGDQLKFKFRDTCSCIVGPESTGKSSIMLLALDEKGNEVNIGNATVYPNQPFPKPGDIVEVEYLYYFPEGALYQPVLKEIRIDVERGECLLSKLKIKQELETE